MRATFQSSGTKQVRWFPGMGRCSQAQRAPREPPHRRKRQGGQARRGVPAARPAPRAPAPPRLAMVEQGDAAPLLRWAEGPAVSVPQDPALQAGGWVRGGSGGGRAAAEAAGRREPDEPAPPEVLLQPGRLELGDVEEDQVVAVFVVTFDPRSGESRLGMEGWGAVEEAAHWVSGGAGEGLAAHALAPTHLHPSLPGGPGARGRCGSRLQSRGIPGALFRPLLRPAAAALSAALLFAPLQCGRIGLRQRAHWLLFSLFSSWAGRFLETPRGRTPPHSCVRRLPRGFRTTLLCACPCSGLLPAP